ncbi:hypothetical protein MHYP_G00354610 [Metynnis hypsauchen]
MNELSPYSNNVLKSPAFCALRSDWSLARLLWGHCGNRMYAPPFCPYMVRPSPVLRAKHTTEKEKRRTPKPTVRRDDKTYCSKLGDKV